MKTKTQFTNRILSLVLSIMMAVSMLPMNVLTANAAETTESAIDLSTLTGTYVISDSGEYTFTDSGSYGIKVESGNPTIVLNNASIMVGEGSSIDVASGSNATIFVLGDNTIGTTKTESWNEPCGGIFVAEGGTVNITSNGTNNILRAHGTLAAAIGGKYDYDNNESYNAGSINISNVTVYAYTNNFYAAAIGAAGEGTCGTINITNAVIYAYGAGDKWTSAPGIGNAWSLLDWSDTIPIVIISDSEVHTFRYNPYSDYIGYLGDESGDTYATGSINCGEGGSVKSSTIYCYTGLDATTTDKTVKYGALGGLLKEDGTCEGEHSGGTATCTTLAVCENCGASYGELLDHNWENGECTYGCNTQHDPHDWESGICNVCGLVCAHTGGAATCTTLAVCDICGTSYGEVGGHTAEPTYAPNAEDSTKHDATYSCCGNAVTEDHTLTYSASGNVITVSCSKCKATLGTATISATGKIYDGTAVELIVSKTGSLENTDIPVILTKDGEAFTGEPVNAGAYTASVTLGDKTVSVDFTIAKAAAIITAAPTPDTLTYFGEAQYLISVGEAAGGKMVYSLTENGEYTTSIPQGTNAGDYTVWYYVQGDANHKDSAKDFVSVTIAKAPLTVTADAKIKTYGDKDPTLTYTAEGLLGGDTLFSALTGALTREEGENVGLYAITLGTLSADNYTISFEGADFTIMDITAPTGTILIKENSWNKFWNTTTFGIFCKDDVDVTITADGTGSGIAKVEYLLSDTTLDENNIPTEGWTEIFNNNGKYSFSIKTQNKVAVYVRITDESDNVTVINSDGIVVYEDSKAVVTEVTYTYKENSDKDIAVEFNGNTVNSIVCGEKVLAANTDYSVDYESAKIVLTASYLDTLNADDYAFTISYNPMGVENSGVIDLTTTFIVKVEPTSIAGATVTVNGTFTYDGNAKTPDPVIVLNGETLVKDKDYTVSYAENVNPGTATVTIQGIGNFKGTVTKTFTIICDHSHSKDKYSNNGDGTHDKVCSVCGYVENASEPHSYIYTADETTDTIAHICICSDVEMSFTLNIPTATYGDSPMAVPHFTCSDTTYAGEFPVITIDGEENNFPTNAGTYEVIMTWGEVSVSGEYVVKKAEASVLTAPIGNTMIYNGEAQELITAGTAKGGTMLYALSEDGDYTTEIPTATNAGDYTVWYYVQGDENHIDSPKVSVAAEIVKAKITAMTPPEDMTLTGYFTNAEDIIAILPTTIEIESEDDTSELPIEWTFAGEFDVASNGENTFTWTADIGDLDANGFAVFGEITVTNVEYVVINEENFPDEIFRNYVNENFDTTDDDVLTAEEIAAVTMIRVSNEGIADLTGIEYFTKLSYLDCSSNQLKFLDVSKNTKLGYLGCSYNQIERLDVSNNANLLQLNCNSNQLTTLDIDSCTEIDTLLCAENLLTALDVSNHKELLYLACSYNQLTSLNVIGCTALNNLYCDTNQLTSLDVSNNTALIDLDCSKNKLTSLDVSNNANLLQLNCNSNQLTTLDIDSCTEMDTLLCTENLLTALDVSNHKELSYLACSYNQLTSLNVIGCTALNNLYCGTNQLISLDVSTNTALTDLNCASNQLTSLDVSNNTALIDLYCEENIFTIEFIEGKFDLSTMPEGFDITKVSEWHNGTVNGTILSIIGSAENITYTYTLGNGETAIFTLKCKGQIYDIADAEIVFDNTLTYNGEEQKQIVIVYYDGIRLSSVHCKISGNRGTDAGNYTLTIEGLVDFYGTKTVNWTIAKATPEAVPIISEDEYFVGDALPEIGYESKISGIIEWLTELVNGFVEGENVLEWQFTPDDADNYEVVTGTAVVVAQTTTTTTTTSTTTTTTKETTTPSTTTSTTTSSTSTSTTAETTTSSTSTSTTTETTSSSTTTSTTTETTTSSTTTSTTTETTSSSTTTSTTTETTSSSTTTSTNTETTTSSTSTSTTTETTTSSTTTSTTTETTTSSTTTETTTSNTTTSTTTETTTPSTTTSTTTETTTSSTTTSTTTETTTSSTSTSATTETTTSSTTTSTTTETTSSSTATSTTTETTTSSTTTSTTTETTTSSTTTSTTTETTTSSTTTSTTTETTTSSTTTSTTTETTTSSTTTSTTTETTTSSPSTSTTTETTTSSTTTSTTTETTTSSTTTSTTTETTTTSTTTSTTTETTTSSTTTSTTTETTTSSTTTSTTTETTTTSTTTSTTTETTTSSTTTSTTTKTTTSSTSTSTTTETTTSSTSTTTTTETTSSSTSTSTTTETTTSSTTTSTTTETTTSSTTTSTTTETTTSSTSTSTTTETTTSSTTTSTTTETTTSSTTTSTTTETTISSTTTSTTTETTTSSTTTSTTTETTTSSTTTSATTETTTSSTSTSTTTKTTTSSTTTSTTTETTTSSTTTSTTTETTTSSITTSTTTTETTTSSTSTSTTTETTTSSTTTSTTTETTSSSTTTSTTTETTTSSTTTTLPQTGYSVIYNYIMLAAAAMMIFGIYAMAKSRKRDEE